jgi:hypothetical protein
MSRETALDNIGLRSASTWGHTEYSLEHHTAYGTRVTGADPSTPEGSRALFDAWGFDLLWGTQDGLYDDWFAHGRATNMGHAEYMGGGVDRKEPAECPFHTVEEVWAFDAVQEYGLPVFEEQVSAYETLVREARERFPHQLTTGGYYKTMVSGAIQAFGWDMFLQAAADRRKIEKVLDGFYRRALFHMRAWAGTSAPVIIQHDDFVWSAGAFMHPDIYRRMIIPRYAELWKPLRAAGKKVLFCSDGTWTEFAQDIADAGADGLIFEPSNDFGFMVERFGGSHCLVGSFVDCRDLTFGLWDKVEKDVTSTFRLLERCRGAIVAVGNHLPANITDEMLERYIDAVRPRLPRGVSDRR